MEARDVGKPCQIFFRGRAVRAREGETVEDVRGWFRVRDPEVDLVFEDPAGFGRIVYGEWTFSAGQKFRTLQPLERHDGGEGWMEMPKWQ